MVVLTLGLAPGCDSTPDEAPTTAPASSTDLGTTSSDSSSPEGTTGGPDAPGTSSEPESADSYDDGSSGAGDPDGSDGGSAGDTGKPAGGIGDLFWLVDGESGAPQPHGTRHDGLEAQICEVFADEALSFVELPDAYGDMALRLVMRQEWPWGTSNACDSKMRGLLMDRESVQIEQGTTSWTGWAVYVPDDWTMKNNGGVTVLNIHGPPGTPPQIRVNLNDDHWVFKGRGDLNIDTETWELETGQWHEFVMEASFEKNDDGYIKLWHKLRDQAEWTQRADFEGQTAQGGADFPFHIRFGFDIANQEWGDASEERVLYYDEVRVGRPMSSFDEVAPGSHFEPPAS